jgi:hypothetical protein
MNMTKNFVVLCFCSLLLKTVSNATSLRASVAPSIVPENLSDDGVKKASYGADISWPMQHDRVSTNYPWLPHNVDPENNPIPVEYIGMPLQPLGDRQKAFEGKGLKKNVVCSLICNKSFSPFHYPLPFNKNLCRDAEKVRKKELFCATSMRWETLPMASINHLE